MLHKDLTGADLHVPKAHVHVKADITDFPAFVTGPAGPTGATGADSEVPGPTGAAGAKGDQGIQGIQGTAGTNGTNGTDGTDGVDGDAFVYADFTEGQLAALVGAQGEQGIQGIQGTAGSNGAKGDTGTAGAAGAKGDTGTTGAAGSNGTNGTNGAKGDTGSAGATGAAGAKGDTGSAGAAGAKGDAGAGVVVGGTATQVLAKIDSTDFNTHWVDPATGGGDTTGLQAQLDGVRPFPAPVVTGTYAVPLTIEHTGATEVSAALNAFIASVPNGSIISFPIGATYLLHASILISDRNNLIFEGNGTTLQVDTTAAGNSAYTSPFFSGYEPGHPNRDIVIHDFIIIGNDPTPGVFDDDYQSQANLQIYITTRIEVYNITGSAAYGDFAHLEQVGGVWIHDCHALTAGRQGVSVLSGSDILVEDCAFDVSGYCTFDVEPNDIGDACSNITIRNNTAGTWGWLFLGVEGAHTGAPIDQITVDNNTVTGGSLLMGVDNYGVADTRMTRIAFTNNKGTVAAGPVLNFAHVDGLTVFGNDQPLSSGVLVSAIDCTGIGTGVPMAGLQVGTFGGEGYATYPGEILVGNGGHNGPDTPYGIELESSFGGTGAATKLYTDNASDSFGIATRFLSATWVKRVTVKEETGNVGIGTVAPLSKLAINGGLHVGGDSDAGDNNAIIDGSLTVGASLVSAAGLALIDDANAAAQLATLGAAAASAITNVNNTSDATKNAAAVTVTNHRFTRRVNTQTTTDTITPEISTYDIFVRTAQAHALVINNHSTSTPVDGDMLLFEILSDATPRAITYGNKYVAKAGVALPAATVASKNLTMLFIWRNDLTVWNLLSAGQEA